VTRATELMAAIEAIGPGLGSRARESEELGRLSPETFTALQGAGMFDMLIAQDYGGIELSSLDYLRAVERLMYHDGASGWVTMASRVSTALASAFLPDRGADEVFGSKLSIVAGQGAPNGKAEAVNGGFVLNGRWNYGSGTLHCDYVLAGAFVFDNGQRRDLGGGRPEMRLFIVPRAEVQLEGNWDVLGLQATGSVDYSMSDVFVPESRCFPTASREPKRGGKFFTLGLSGFTALGHSAFALGLGRRALDEIVEVYRVRAQRRPQGPAATVDLGAFSLAYGAAEAKFQAARALVYDVWTDIQASLDEDGTFTTEQLTRARLALNHVTTVAVDVCTFAYRTGGGIALRESLLQRCFREVNVGAQHLQTTEEVLRECGRALAGFAEGEVWEGVKLVPAR